MPFKTNNRYLRLVIMIVLMSMVLIPQPTQATPDVRFGWAKSMGGITYDDNSGLVVDANNNVYTTGLFQGTVDFDPGAGVFNLTSAGSTEAFISKLDQNGNLLWAKSMGGQDAENGQGIAIDSLGNIYILGRFNGTTDVDPGAGVFPLTTAGAWDGFIAKLDDSGNLIWAKSFGGTSEEIPWNIFVDASGNIYTTGFFNGTADFDPGLGVYNLTPAGSDDIFILKLDSSGDFIWAKSMGGTSMDVGYDIVVDPLGNVYTTGYFQMVADFDPGAGTSTLSAGGWPQVFVSKLDSSGNFVWAKGVSGGDNNVGYGIALDSGGNVYTIGIFGNTADFDPGVGTFGMTSAGQSDAFISKLDGNGNFVWAKSIGGTGPDWGQSILTDSAGKVYAAGFFSSTVDFDPGVGTFKLTSAGEADIYATMLDTNGNFVWAKSFGGTGYDTISFGFSIDPSGNVYVAGNFWGTADFDPGSGKFNLTSVGATDLFITKLYKSFSPTFADVPASHSYYNDIEILYANGLTGGCGTNPLRFCPDQIMDRAMAAVFMVRGAYGAGYVPNPTSYVFRDNWSKAPYARAWAEAMRETNLTTGCQASPPLYCPMKQLNREQAVIFGLKMKYGTYYLPPPATGTVFADMTNPSYYATAWAEKAYADGLITDCGTLNGKPKFCPTVLVTRGLGAYIIVRAKGLTMP